MLCEIVEENVQDEEQNMRTVYGFRFLCETSKEVILVLRDVFTEKEKALSLQALIEQNDPDASQILDIVEDALCT